VNSLSLPDMAEPLCLTTAVGTWTQASGEPQSERQVDVLQIAEESFVEAAQLKKVLAIVHRRCGTRPEGFRLGLLGPWLWSANISAPRNAKCMIDVSCAIYPARIVSVQLHGSEELGLRISRGSI
jgi:hypothetical protein